MATTQTAQMAAQTAARARTMTQVEWQQRAIELAEQQHLLYRSTYLGANEAGEIVFTTPSKHEPYAQYVQRITSHTGKLRCDCKAGQWGMPCGHAGSALHHWKQIVAAMSAAAREADRRYHEFAEWLERQGF